LDIGTLIWMFPFVFIIHDLEEILTVQSFMIKRREQVIAILPQRLSQIFLKQFSLTSKQFAIAVGFILIFVLLGTFLGAHSIKNGETPMGFLLLNIVFFVHVFTHIGQAIVIRGYTPGVITAALLVLPYSSYAFYGLFRTGLVDWNTVFTSAPFGLLIIPIVLIGHTLGRKTYSKGLPTDK
jgi:hypothetical protein